MTDAVLQQTTIEQIAPPQEKTEKPEIKIVKKEVDNTHYYFVNDEWFPGVTSILDEAAPMPFGLRSFLLNNTPESAQEIKDMTAGLGSKLHDAYEKLLNGVELNLGADYKTTKEKKHLVSFWQWYKDVKPTEMKTEHTIASLKYKIAGTLDLKCKINGKNVIVDFKTGANIYWSHGLQLAAYKELYQEMTGETIDEIYVLRTGSRHKSGYEFKLITETFDAFLNVYNTYLKLHGGKIPEPPLIDVYPELLKLEI